MKTLCVQTNANMYKIHNMPNELILLYIYIYEK